LFILAGDDLRMPGLTSSPAGLWSEKKSIASRSDNQVTAIINASYARDGLVSASDINIDSQNGVVILDGTVSSEAAKNRAIALARRTKGVTKVISNLVVASES